MQKALADFRVESDTVVYLTFSDGRSYRVDPKDLDRFLESKDLRRVRQALRVRNQFIRRVLPPTVLVVLVAGIIGLGRYDMYRVARNWVPARSAHTQAQVPKVTPATSGQSPAKTSSGASVQPAAPVSSASPSNSTTAALAPTATKSPTATPTAVSPRTATSAIQSTSLPVPVQTTSVLPQILQPLTAPLARTVQQLPKLLP